LNQPLLVPRASSLVLRAGLVTAVVLAFFGIATGIIPINCLMGACGPEAPTKVAAEAAAEAAKPSSEIVTIVKDASNEAPRDAQPMAQVAAATPAPSLSGDDMITGSFALLPAALQKIPEPLKPLAPTAATAKTSRGDSAGLTTRTVRALAVNPDGTPNLPSSMVEAYAAPAPDSDEVRTAAALAAEAAAKGKPATPEKSTTKPEKPAPKVAEAAAPSATPDAGSGGVVKGGGVNVRSSPKRGENSVLFSLNGGAKITIGENKNGWLHITDKDGRRGWVYKDFVTAN
jgi:hypothetical protein